MKTVYYNLYHVYEEIQEDGIEEYIKFIGMFSSKIEAEKAISILIQQPGFKTYPKKCFEVHKSRINLYGWETGFCSWKEAEEYQKNMEEYKNADSR